MKKSKKLLFALLSVLIILSLCVVVLLFAFPDLLSSDPSVEPPIVIEATEQMVDDAPTEASTEVSMPDDSLTLAESSIEASEPVDSLAETDSEESDELTAQSENDPSTTDTLVADENTDFIEESLALSASETTPAETETVIEDHQAPVFLAFDSAPQVEVGKEFDIHKFMGYADDVDRDVAMEVSGTVDTSTEGTYPVKITLTDDAGHTTSKSMDVKVVTTKSKSGGNSKTENFSDFINTYKTEETSVGIDISRWQEAVDFEKVKNAGCEFVYMRIGGLDDGELYTDRYYQANIAGAKAAGLKIGIYWHAEESTPEEVKKSVEYLCNVLGGEPVDYPIAYDWEDFMNFERYGMNLQDINDCFTAFANEMHARGFSACLYGSKNYLENVWTNETNQHIWLAHYTSSTSYAGEHFMWQHSCTGRIDGVNGDVDLDVLYNKKVNP